MAVREIPRLRRALVFGPAYLDRVLRVNAPLVDPALGGPVDRSVEARLDGEGGAIELVGPSGGMLEIVPPEGWPGPSGAIRLASDLAPGRRRLRALAWHDDLGGMGAGFARALGGELISALGPEGDAMSRTVSGLLDREGIRHRPLRVPDRPADWTLLVTSGPHGDKLPLGFRGCHAAVRSVAGAVAGIEPPGVVAVAGLPNAVTAEALGRFPGAVRLLAPSSRNTADRDPPLGALADRIDLLSCNRGEWESLPEPDRARLESSLALIAVTDGPRGATLRFRGAGGGLDRLAVPAFPRLRPPRDTNRAGEAFASTLLTALLDAGWSRGQPLSGSLVESAARRASAASALVLDLERFGFPEPPEVDAALRAGEIA